MLKKIVLLFTGILLCSYSLMFMIVYLNLLKMGYSFIEYLKYIFTHIECLIGVIGIIFIYFSFFKKNE